MIPALEQCSWLLLRLLDISSQFGLFQTEWGLARVLEFCTKNISAAQGNRFDGILSDGTGRVRCVEFCESLHVFESFIIHTSTKSRSSTRINHAGHTQCQVHPYPDSPTGTSLRISANNLHYWTLEVHTRIVGNNLSWRALVYMHISYLLQVSTLTHLPLLLSCVAVSLTW